MNPSASHLADRVFGTEPKQRLRLQQCATAMLLVLGSVLVMQYLVWMRFAPAAPVAWWSLVLVGGFALFFLTIRSGRNLRYAEPSLTVPQMGFAIVCTAVAYGLAGRGRAATFPLLMVIFMFSMYSLPAVLVLRMCLFALAAFALTMTAMALHSPHLYPPAVEVAHFVMLGFSVPVIALLAAQLSRQRERLRRQNKEMALALARIQEQATRDGLTGLINRRHMLELLEQERQRGVRSGQSFCIAMIDLTELRPTAPQDPRAASDAAVTHFAQAAMAAIRICDLLCRWEGKRFMLMLSNTRVSLARLSVERLRERIEALPNEALGAGPHISFTAGVTEHRAGESVAQTVQRAEQGLATARGSTPSRVALA